MIDLRTLYLPDTFTKHLTLVAASSWVHKYSMVDIDALEWETIIVTR